MKIHKEEQKFTPVTLIIESIDELMGLVRISAACPNTNNNFGGWGSYSNYCKLADMAELCGVNLSDYAKFPKINELTMMDKE